MKVTIEFLEIDHANVSQVARQLTSRYRDYVEYEDVQQELYVWYIKHYRKVDAWREEHHEKTAQRLILKSLRNAGEKYCRKEKADKDGYEVEDEFFYSIGMVSDMLQLYFDPDWSAPTVTLEHTSEKRPAGEGGNLMAMVADVGRCFEQMPEADQELLQRIYGGDYPVRDAMAYEAAMNDITIGAQDRRIRRVVGRLRAKLGGPRPYEEDE